MPLRKAFSRSVIQPVAVGYMACTLHSNNSKSTATTWYSPMEAEPVAVGVQLTTTIRPAARVTPLVMTTSASMVPGFPAALSVLSRVGAVKPNSGTVEKS